MKEYEFPYVGFRISWFFYDDDKRYEGYLENQIATNNIYIDIHQIISITSKYELLIPTYIVNDKREKIHFESSDPNLLIDEIRSLVNRGQLSHEIEEIGGYGIVYLANGEKVKQQNLITLDSIRFFERRMAISTIKNVWVPLSVKDMVNIEWQIELATLNASRLEECLREIYQQLGISVEPCPDEIDRDETIWMKDFKLYVDPSILRYEYENHPPEESFDINDFLIE